MMNKIDLIISKIDAFINEEAPMYYLADALAAACELKALEPVAWMYDWYHESENENGEPVGGIVSNWIAAVYSEVSDPTIGAHNIRPLYALDEVNHE